jgi:hypothetical protein
MGLFFKHGDMLALTYLDHQGLPRCRRDQLDVGRHFWRDNVSLDVPQPAERSFRARTSVRRSRFALIELEQAGSTVVKAQRLIDGRGTALGAAEQPANEHQQDTPPEQREPDHRQRRRT